MGSGSCRFKDTLSVVAALVCLAFCGCSGISQSQSGAHPPGVRVWAAGSTEKIQPSGRSELPHTGPWDARARRVRIEGVRGEHVPFHVVVTADRLDLRGVTVELTDLRCGDAVLPASEVKVYLEYFSKVYAPSGKNGRKGYWPDALVPLTRPFTVKSSRRDRGPVLRNQPLWVDVEVPPGQRPGVYEGQLTVKVEGKEVEGSALS